MQLKKYRLNKTEPRYRHAEQVLVCSHTMYCWKKIEGEDHTTCMHKVLEKGDFSVVFQQIYSQKAKRVHVEPP